MLKRLTLITATLILALALCGSVSATSDIGVTKTVNDSTPNVGDTINFTITVTNNGPDDASVDVVVQDVLDPSQGLQYVSDSATQGTYNSSSGLWNITNMSNGATVTLYLQALVVKSGNLTNTAFKLTPLPEPMGDDPNSANDWSTTILNVPPAVDIAVNKTVNNTAPNFGESVGYIIQVTNNGPDNATGVQILDLLPAGFVFTSSSLPSFNATSGIWNIGNLANGSTVTLIISGYVNGTGTINNTASLYTVDQYDWNNTNNESTASMNVAPAVDIAVNKTANNSTVNVGQNVIYTITVTNNGPNNATGVVVTDPLPAGLTYVSDTGAGAYNSGTGAWTIGNLASGASTTLNITATIGIANAGTFVVNTAVLTAVDQFDWNNTNNQSTAIVYVPPAVDIAVNKTVDNATPAVGQNITYTIVVSNNGPNTANGVIVVDTLPAGLQYVGSTGPVYSGVALATGSWNGTAFIITGAFANGSSATFTLTATVLMSVANQTVNNTAALTNVTEYDWNNTNNASTVSINVLPAVDIAVNKTANNVTVPVGQNVVYTVMVKNNGPNDATNVVVTDVLPAGLSFVSAQINTGIFNSGTGVWTISSLANGASATLNITATVLMAAAGSTVNNTANLTSVDQFDWNNTNNVSTASIDVPPAVDIAVNKTVDNATPGVGQNITYTITVTNNGPNTAHNAVVVDTLPAGLQYVSYVAGPYANAAVLDAWNGTSLILTGVYLPGGYATYYLTATVLMSVANQTVNNTAALTNVTETDWNNTNNASTVSINVLPAVDIAVEKTVDNATPSVGQIVTYTITVSNNGPNDATNVVVTDVLPAGLLYITNGLIGSSGATPGLLTWNAGTNTFTISGWNITSGGYVNASLTAQVLMAAAGQTINNTAALVSVDQFDWNNTNNESTASIEVPPAVDIAVEKTVDDSTPDVGQIITYTIVVRNNGPNSATNAVVSDVLPAGLQYVIYTFVDSADSWGTHSWNAITNTFTLNGTFLPGGYVVYNLTALVLQSAANQTVNNTAALVSVDQFDWNNTNNESTASIEVPPASDVEVTKTVDNATPNYLDNVTFTVTVKNNGPNTAVNTLVSDLLPAGFNLVSATPSAGSYNSGVWTVGDLANGTSAILTLVAQVLGHNATLTNYANASSETYDWNMTNNNASANITVPPAVNIGVIKVVNGSSSTTANVLQTVTYTFLVYNTGPDNASHIVISDLLPAGLVLTPYVITGQSGFGGIISLIGNNLSSDMFLTAGGFVQFEINATIPMSLANSTVVNTLNLVSVDQYDWWNMDNSSTAVINVPPAADVVVTKEFKNDTDIDTPGITTANYRDAVFYRIHVTNNGPNNATGLQITDPIPAGLTFGTLMYGYVTSYDGGWSWNFDDGTFDTSTGVWTIPYDLAPGQEFILDVWCNVTGSNMTIVNIANKTAQTDYDWNTSNDNATASLEIPPAVDIVVDKRVDNDHPQIGDWVTWVIEVSNFGPDNATGVQIFDLLPAGVNFVSYIADAGTYNETTGIWDIGNFPAFTTLVLNITTIVNPANGSSNVTNNASVANVDQYDWNTLNDESSAILYLPVSNISITKSADKTSMNVGENVIWTINVTNNGPNFATNVNISDLLPAGMQFVTVNAPDWIWTFDGTYVNATIAQILAGATSTINITMTALPASAGTNQTNMANMTSLDQYDPDNASGNATVYVKAVDVVVNKTVNNTTPNYRANVTYTVTASNNGPDNATGVVVTDLLPAGMSFVSATPSVGSYVSATGIWTIGNLASGASATLQIIAQVMDANKTITNTANLTAVTEYDTNPLNNGSSVSIYVPPSADIAVTKTTTNNNPLVCENFNWTITVVNNGPNDATGVMVSDILPAGLNLVSFTPSQGTYNTATGVWTVGTLLNGSTATLVFVVNATHALCGVTTTNNAYKLAEDQYDWNSSNNIGSSSIQVPGDTTYSVKVTNNGVSLIQCVYYITVYPPCGAAPILNRYVFNLNPGQSRTITIGTYCVGTSISTDEFVYNRATGTRTISVTNVWAATGFAPYVQPFVVTNVPAGGLTHAMKRFWTTKDALNVYIVSPPRRM